MNTSRQKVFWRITEKKMLLPHIDKTENPSLSRPSAHSQSLSQKSRGKAVWENPTGWRVTQFQQEDDTLGERHALCMAGGRDIIIRE